MRKLVPFLVLLAFIGAAHAQVRIFVGLPGSTVFLNLLGSDSPPLAA